MCGSTRATADGHAHGELLAPDAESLASMQRDIEAAAAAHDFVAVALHKGVVHTPVKLAPYERAVSQAAIDADADVVLGHHAHMIRGIDWYRGKPIFTASATAVW